MIVDDDEGALDLYSHLLKEQVKAHIMSTKFPSAALKLAHTHFFDLILIDVTMNYNGTPFGGLELYKSLVGRYGDSSLIAYSQFITDDLLKQYEYDFNFFERGTNPVKFIERIVGLLDSLRKRQSCFVAMPFNKMYDPMFQIIKECIERVHYRCVRVDQQHFTKSIIEKIFTEIASAKLIAFLATDQNPNAFYECGYSIALRKEVITLTDVFKNLPFDIRDRNAIAYGKDMRKLRRELLNKLNNLTNIV
ncbi:MAG TPA: response regulator [Pyrinomonadaceae bacterium]|nr:response regulator [Pyrinomonadaceae bacterium]